MPAALALHRTIGSRHGEANTLHALADTALERGDLTLADQHATQSLSLYRTIGDQLSEATVLGTLARIASQDGRREDARHHSASPPRSPASSWPPPTAA
ncbi:tetratricopeptide repeat protein [Streptomyces sp. NPDC000618]|uniref:tetratricopeptide repeat protein n=1 Tax=Streptomyces sp. NPDC000618 TaxID=3154265 RepID=UPI00331894C3